MSQGLIGECDEASLEGIRERQVEGTRPVNTSTTRCTRYKLVVGPDNLRMFNRRHA